MVVYHRSTIMRSKPIKRVVISYLNKTQEKEVKNQLKELGVQYNLQLSRYKKSIPWSWSHMDSANKIEEIERKRQYLRMKLDSVLEVNIREAENAYKEHRRIRTKHI